MLVTSIPRSHSCPVQDSLHFIHVHDPSFHRSVLPQQVESPILAYTAEGEVNALEWYQQNGERNWVGIAFDNKMQILRV